MFYVGYFDYRHKKPGVESRIGDSHPTYCTPFPFMVNYKGIFGGVIVLLMNILAPGAGLALRYTLHSKSEVIL
jgi:hypothetical protein